MTAQGNQRTFVALVTFQRITDDLGILPEWAEGACGWMGIRAQNEAMAIKTIQGELGEIGLCPTEIDEVTEIRALDDVMDIDSHLASNMQEWKDGTDTVWGTIHSFVGEGEA